MAPVSPIAHRGNLTDATPQTEPMKERIKWPKMSDTMEWASFDEGLDRIPKATLAVEWKAKTLTMVTYNLAKERFGTTERKTNTKAEKKTNRREREIH